MARHLLLPGEKVADYREFIEAWLDSVRPQGAAEVQVAVCLADLHWRLGRLLFAVHRTLETDMEVRMRSTSPFRELSALKNAITGTRALVETLEQTASWTKEAANALRGPLEGVERLLREVHAGHADRLRKLAEKLEEYDARPTIIEELRGAATQLLAFLERRVRENKKNLDAARKDVASIASPSEAEMRRLDRYRRFLAAASDDQLAVLASLKNLRVGGARRQRTRGSSFGQASRKPSATVRLRVVR